MKRPTVQSERAETRSATQDSFEEIYTNLDLSEKATYDPAIGYPFMYPLTWLENPSQNKKISVRRMDLIPAAHTFDLSITSGQDTDHKAKHHFQNFTRTFNVREDGMHSVLTYICNQFHLSNRNIVARLQFNYESNTKNKVTFKAFAKGVDGTDQVKDDPEFYQVPFKITGTDEHLNQFLMLLNQETTAEKRKILTDESDEKTFPNVWNRESAYIHADFSTSNRQLIGLNHDFYPYPTFLYPPPTTQTSFNIRFTSDGRTPIHIRYCSFRIQLCFITNYKNTLAF